MMYKYDQKKQNKSKQTQTSFSFLTAKEYFPMNKFIPYYSYSLTVLPNIWHIILDFWDLAQAR